MRVRELLLENVATVKFFAPDVAYADARKYLPAWLEKRGVKSAAAMMVLDTLESIVRPSNSTTMPVCNNKRSSELPCAMPMTGRFSRVP